MSEFKVGDTVQITGSVMTGNVGVIVHRDEEGRGFLVRITEETQNYFPADELLLFEP